MLELWLEYSLLLTETQRLSVSERMSLAELTRMPAWASLAKMMDVWKQKVMVKALQNCVNDKDIASMQGQCRIMAYIKNLPNRLKDAKPSTIEGSDDPATNIEI